MYVKGNISENTDAPLHFFSDCNGKVKVGTWLLRRKKWATPAAETVRGAKVLQLEHHKLMKKAFPFSKEASNIFRRQTYALVSSKFRQWS